MAVDGPGGSYIDGGGLRLVQNPRGGMVEFSFCPKESDTKWVEYIILGSYDTGQLSEFSIGKLKIGINILSPIGQSCSCARNPINRKSSYNEDTNLCEVPPCPSNSIASNSLICSCSDPKYPIFAPDTNICIPGNFTCPINSNPLASNNSTSFFFAQGSISLRFY